MEKIDTYKIEAQKKRETQNMIACKIHVRESEAKLNKISQQYDNIVKVKNLDKFRRIIINATEKDWDRKIEDDHDKANKELDVKYENFQVEEKKTNSKLIEHQKMNKNIQNLQRDYEELQQ